MKALESLYDNASVPDSLPPGKYKVVAFKGVPKLPWHTKTVIRNPGIEWQTGYNRSIFKWGEFYFVDGDGALVLVYFKGNIRDNVRRVSEGVYIGKYYRKGKMKGYFMLVKIGG